MTTLPNIPGLGTIGQTGVVVETLLEGTITRQRIRLYEMYGKPDMTNSLDFDAVVSIIHSGKSTVTRNPVEAGADATDNSRPEPREVRLSEAIVTNHPTSFPEALRRIGSKPDIEAWAKLQKWRREGTVLTLVTDVEPYDNMVIQALEMPRDAAHAHSMHATINLVEVAFAETSTTQGARAGRDSAAAPKSDGQKPKTPATEEDKSLFYEALQASKKGILGR